MGLALIFLLVAAMAVPAGAGMIHESGTFVIPDDLALVPDPGMLDAAGCQEGTYVMVEGIFDFDAKYSEDELRQKGTVDWIDSTWMVEETGVLYGFTERSGWDFKVAYDADYNLLKGKGYWLMEWFDLTTGEITDYIRIDFGTGEYESTCGD
jgi:hypothetical protein